MKNNITISLIIPCYNEETNLQKGVLDKIGNFTKSDKRFTEILIVDDGSSDNSREIIKTEYIHQFPKLKLLENPHQGKALSVITGIEKSTANYTMFSDFDLATPIEESEKLIQGIQEGYEVVIGSRNTHREGAPLLRRIQSVGWIFLRSLIIGLRGIKDTQCGFKIFDRKAALEIINRLQVFKHNRHIEGSSVSAGFDLEFLFLAKKLHFKIKEIPVIWRHVETKRVSFFKDSIESLTDILKIKYYDLKGKYNAQ